MESITTGHHKPSNKAEDTSKINNMGLIMVKEPWWLALEASTRLIIISINARFNLGPAREVIEWGCSWPGVFLLGASGRTGRFFTQLLFHHHHSLSSFFFVVHNNGNVCVPQLFKQVLLGSQVLGLKFLGLSFYWFLVLVSSDFWVKEFLGPGFFFFGKSFGSLFCIIGAGEWA